MRPGLPRWIVPVLAVVVLVLVAVATGVALTSDDKDEQEASVPRPGASEQQLADQSLLAASDLPGYTVGSTAAVEYPTYGKCWGEVPLLSLAGPGRTAAAQSPGYRRGPTFVATAVVLADTPAAGIAAFGALDKTDAFSCILEAFRLAVETGTGRFGQSLNIEAVREPPLGDQSIGYRIEVVLGPLQSRRLDVTIVRTGRGLGFLFTAAEREPFPESERQRLALALARRLPA